MKRLNLALITLLLITLFLAACGASAPTPAVVEKAVYNDSAPPREAPAAAAPAMEAGMGNQIASEQIQSTRKIIYNADMALVVEDTEKAAQEISDLATNMGGYVASMNGYRRDDQMYFDITIRIPSDKFEAGRNALRDLAVRVEHENVSTNDVTDQYFDIDARLRTLKATEEELTALLKETRERGGKVEDVMKVYNRLIEIRSEIESLQGQLNRLDKLVGFSTLDIHLQPYVLASSIESSDWRPAEIIHNSIATLMNALTGLATLIIQLVIVVLPLLLIVILPLALLFWLLNKWRKRKTSVASARPTPKNES